MPGELSYEQISDVIYKAIPDICCICDLYDDRVVYKMIDDEYYQRGYSIVDGNLTLGDPVEVEKKIEYVQVQAACRISGAQKKGTDDYGYKWRVRVVDFGIDKNGTHWTKEPLVAALSLFDGAKVFMLSEAQHQTGSHPYGKSPREIVGWLANVSVDDRGIEADLNILKTADLLAGALVDSWERGNPDLFGLSIDLYGSAEERQIGGKKVSYLLKANKVSVDVVYEPAAGGKFLRLAAAINQIKQNKKEEEMLEKLLAALKAKRPDAYKTIEARIASSSVTEEEVINLLAADKGDGDPVRAAEKILDDARIVACGITLEKELSGSGLPDLSQDRIKEQFKDKLFEPETLRAAIKKEKEYIDKLTGSGIVTGSGDVRVTQGDLESRIKMLDDFFGGKVHSFKACYAKITGDEQVTGQLKAASRLRASIDTTTWAEILGDSVARRMLADYNASGMTDWRKIVSIVPLADFRTNRRMRMGGYGDLPTVAQGGAYTALASPADEEATYAAAKKGGTEDITLEAIKNDDAGSIRRVPQKLARAAARTLYKFVFDFLKDNPNIYDGTALFTAGHGNLGSAALAAAALSARRQAMLKQTELTSSEVLGIPPKYLIVSVDLDKTGYDLVAGPRNSDFEPTSADYTRTLQMELIVVPYWTDTNDWCLSADPADIPTIEVGFLDGREEPELYTQDLPNVGSMFNNDKLTYKIRHIYGGAVMDYRGLDKSVVA